MNSKYSDELLVLCQEFDSEMSKYPGTRHREKQYDELKTKLVDTITQNKFLSPVDVNLYNSYISLDTLLEVIKPDLSSKNKYTVDRAISIQKGRTCQYYIKNPNDTDLFKLIKIVLDKL